MTLDELVRQPAFLSALIAASVSLMIAVPTIWLGRNTWRQARLTYLSNREARIEDLYDRLMDYRLKHPEVFRLSRGWTPECLTKIYTQVDEVEKDWAIYVGYVELCISYCNVVLYAQRRRQLDADVYASHHQPLVKMLITEHFPIMHQFSQQGFASTAIADFIVRERKLGWNWEEVYATMDQVRDRRAKS